MRMISRASPQRLVTQGLTCRPTSVLFCYYPKLVYILVVDPRKDEDGKTDRSLRAASERVSLQ